MNTAIPPSRSSALDSPWPGRQVSPSLIIIFRLWLGLSFAANLAYICWRNELVHAGPVWCSWQFFVVLAVLLVLPSIAVVIGIGLGKRWGLWLAVTHNAVFLAVVVGYSYIHPSILALSDLQDAFHHGAHMSRLACATMLIESYYILISMWSVKRTAMAFAALALAVVGIGRVSYLVGQAELRSLYEPLLEYSGKHWLRMPENLKPNEVSYIGPNGSYGIYLRYTESRDVAYGTDGTISLYAQRQGWHSSFRGKNFPPAVVVDFDRDAGRTIGSPKDAMSLLRSVLVDASDLRFVEALPPAPRRQHPLWVFYSAKLRAKFLVYQMGFSVYSDTDTGR